MAGLHCRGTSMTRRTIVVPSRLAWHEERFRAAEQNALGLQILTPPQLAGRLAGGFLEAASRLRNVFILFTSTSESGRSLSSVSCFQRCQMPICLFVAAEFWLHLFRTKYVACTSIINNHPPARLLTSVTLRPYTHSTAGYPDKSASASFNSSSSSRCPN